jgi:hypothetical protein
VPVKSVVAEPWLGPPATVTATPGSPKPAADGPMKTSVTLPDSEYVGAGAPSCETATDCPATVSVALRDEGPFAVALNPTVPLPVPLPPDVIVSQAALDAAVHAQPAVVVTATVLEPPATGNETAVRERL